MQGRLTRNLFQSYLYTSLWLLRIYHPLFIYVLLFLMLKTYVCNREKGRKYSSYIGVPICVLLSLISGWLILSHFFLLKKRKEKSFMFSFGCWWKKMNSFLSSFFSFLLHKSLNPRSNINIKFNSFSYNFVGLFVGLRNSKKKKQTEKYIFYLQIKIKFICECWLFIMKECHEWLIQNFTSYLWIHSLLPVFSSSFLFCIFYCEIILIKRRKINLNVYRNISVVYVFLAGIFFRNIS